MRFFQRKFIHIMAMLCYSESIKQLYDSRNTTINYYYFKMIVINYET